MPGPVDLPVQRDALGFPVVFASSIKGALKNLCVKQLKCKINDKGRVRCGDGCELCCCIFGGEPGEMVGAGLLTIDEMVPLAFPVASADQGYVYITSPLLLRKTLNIYEHLLNSIYSIETARQDVTKLYDEIRELLNKSNKNYAVSLIDGNRTTIDISGSTIPIVKADINKESLEKLRDFTRNLGGIAETLVDKLIIIPDEYAKTIIEKSLTKVTRVRLQYDKKTVQGGGLWTEEYISHGTLFTTALVPTYKLNDYCGRKSCIKVEKGMEEYLDVSCIDNVIKSKIEEFRNKVLKPQNNIIYITIGGKETIGKGLMKAYVATYV